MRPISAIDHEGGARHVADVFEQVEQREQQQDLRQEDDHRADARDHAVGDEICEQARRERRAHCGRRDADARRRSRPSRASPTRRSAGRRAPSPARTAACRALGAARCGRSLRWCALRSARRTSAASSTDATQPRRSSREAGGGTGGRLQVSGCGSRRRSSLEPEPAMSDDSDDRHAERAARAAEDSSSPPRACSSSIIVTTTQAGRPRPQHLGDERERALERAGVDRDHERRRARYVRDLAARATRETTASSGLSGERL